MELSEVKQKIQDLINKAVEDNNQQKNTLSFLFDKLAEVKELETIDRLRQFQGGNKYLLAYLTYKSIVRANFQPELTEHTKFDEDEQGQDKLLNAIYADVEQFEKKNEPKPLTIEQLSNHLSDRQFLTILSERMGAGAVKRELTQFGKFLIIEDEQGILKVDLERGILEPDPAQELLKKHGLIDNKGEPKAGTTFFPKGTWLNKGEPNTANIEYSEDFKDFVESVKMPSSSLYTLLNERQYKSDKPDFEAILFNGRTLLKMLSTKLKKKEIDREWNGAYIERSGSSAGSGEGGSKYLFYKDDKGIVKLRLWDGKLTEKKTDKTDKAEAIAEAIHGKDEETKN